MVATIIINGHDVCLCLYFRGLDQSDPQYTHRAIGLTAKIISKPAVSDNVFIIIYYHLIMHRTSNQTRANLYCALLHSGLWLA